MTQFFCCCNSIFIIRYPENHKHFILVCLFHEFKLASIPQVSFRKEMEVKQIANPVHRTDADDRQLETVKDLQRVRSRQYGCLFFLIAHFIKILVILRKISIKVKKDTKTKCAIILERTVFCLSIYIGRLDFVSCRFLCLLFPFFPYFNYLRVTNIDSDPFICDEWTCYI
uniref:Transmembrane protein n=1 Tax=Heterorhabditis bacteriophora TaxID=37862 RepID=A0A1I7XAI9_HETBA